MKLLKVLLVFGFLIGLDGSAQPGMNPIIQPGPFCIGGEKCGRDSKIYIDIYGRRVRSLRFFAHDNVGDSKEAKLNVRVDGAYIANNVDVKKDGMTHDFQGNGISGRQLVIEPAADDEAKIKDIYVYLEDFMSMDQASRCVTENYRRYLCRSPSVSEIQSWASSLINGSIRCESVQEDVRRSPEARDPYNQCFWDDIRVRVQEVNGSLNAIERQSRDAGDAGRNLSSHVNGSLGELEQAVRDFRRNVSSNIRNLEQLLVKLRNAEASLYDRMNSSGDRPPHGGN